MFYKALNLFTTKNTTILLFLLTYSTIKAILLAIMYYQTFR